ncbi:DUF2470 domain-containing protein [Speluncibacter jeojiensis]|uniref:DUF2470 domain-containing protein n=1 Tax=Speluncibacter jeojiensis TaxID=2710754 RepID=A0A9X4LZ17_9ACTN|nr:DUF2470 domain-containing protein [Corynebacteriales bacterium D3-21]
MTESTARTSAVPAPTTAELVRSACARATDAVLAVEGVANAVETTVTALHHVQGSGDVVVSVPLDSPAATATWPAIGVTPTAMLEITDLAPLPLREPVRALVWLRGTLHPVPATEIRALLDDIAAEHPHPGLLDVGHTAVLLRLVLSSVIIADSQGAEPVSVRELVDATPDPFWEAETDWLRHLESDHADLVAALSRRLPAALRRGRVRPLGVDRFGIRLRVEREHDDGTACDTDVRLPFGAPVHDVAGLSRAIRALAGCVFLNGLRARST